MEKLRVSRARSNLYGPIPLTSRSDLLLLPCLVLQDHGHIHPQKRVYRERSHTLLVKAKDGVHQTYRHRSMGGGSATHAFQHHKTKQNCGKNQQYLAPCRADWFPSFVVIKVITRGASDGCPKRPLCTYPEGLESNGIKRRTKTKAAISVSKTFETVSLPSTDRCNLPRFAQPTPVNDTLLTPGPTGVCLQGDVSSIRKRHQLQQVISVA